MSDLKKIGIFDDTFCFTTVEQLVAKEVLYRPMDGNHGEQHPKAADYVSDGIPFIMANDLTEGRINYKSCSSITKKQADGLRKGFSKPGDVLVTHKATIGRTALVGDEAKPYIMLTPQVTYYRIKDLSVLDNRYLRHYFDSSLFQQTLAVWAGAGATRAYLGITGQGKLPIVVPPRDKQRKIAAILTAYDELIEVNKRRIALLEKMAEELYREWFVRLRFPGYQNTRFVKGVPEGWEVLGLSELVEDIIDYRGLTPEKLGGRWADDGIIALSALNVKAGELIRLDDSKRVSETLYERWMRKRLQAHDILLTSEAPLGQVYFLVDSEQYVLSQRLFAVRANPAKVTPIYLYQYLRYPIGQGQLHVRATGSTVGGIRQALLRRVEVIVPTDILMKKHQEYALPIKEEIHALWKTNKNLVKSRELLLPRLISGKLSVEDLDIQFPPSMQEAAKASSESS